ncbi:MAG: hypothetical protein JOZ34_04915 [Gammaproteobacteria bacterium]|nr:hypothetical protein [Gammaproteobacteria bacterium]MBV9725689.1 hypothetical protein [Gammaproteobacteria bacterium]
MSLITSKLSNQWNPLVDCNVFSSHSALSAALARAAAAAGIDGAALMTRVLEP